MHRRTIPAIAALALVVMTVGCVGALGQTEGPAADANGTISVSATGEATAEADQVVLRVSVVADGETANEARQRLAANVSSLREGLAAANVSDDQYVTSGYDIRQEHDRLPAERPDDDREPRYVARQSFEITLDDTDRAGSVIDAAVASGATAVDSVQFTLSAAAEAEVKQAALKDAMATARQNAETLAATENLAVGSAIEISTADLGPIPDATEATMAADDGGGTTIDGGPVTVTATVEVVYESE